MHKDHEGFAGERVVISVESGRLAKFSQVLQKGVVVRREVGCSVSSFLHDQLQLNREFVENSIQTVFLDGKPVDDLDAVSVKDGCTLALSSAMPGLVGAAMRRGGYYASLRGRISCGPEEDEVPASARGFVTVKLFNLVAEHLGKRLLESGVFIKKEDLEELAGRLRGPDGTKGAGIEPDPPPPDADMFPTCGLADGLVHLRLNILE